MSNKILNSVQYPGLEDIYINPCSVRKNLLKNWYFVGGGTGENSFPINSRKFELSANTNHVWSIDNWYINGGYGGQWLSPYGMIFTNNQNTAGDTTFQQYLDCFQDDLEGRILTVSALIDDTLYTQSAIIPARTTEDQAPINFNCGVSANGRINIYVIGSDHYSQQQQYNMQYLFQFMWRRKQSESAEVRQAQVIAFKVEIGEGQTLCHKEGSRWILDDVPNYQKELLRCQISNSNDQDSYSNQQFGFNVSNPNLLANWYFVGGGTGNNVFPVNQRGSFSYISAVQYTIDRWKTSNTGTSVLLYDDALRLRSDSGSTYGYLLQYIDQQEYLLNKLVTLSILTTTELYTSTVKLPSVLPSVNTIYANIPNIGHILCLNGKWLVRLCADYNSYENYVAVKLELGIHQTLAHKEDGVWVLNEIPDYREELLRCQTSTADPSDVYENKVVSVDIPNRNLLDNWYFVGGGGQQGGGQFPINQRGQTSYTGSVYTIDRWKGSNNYGSSQIDSTGLTVVGSTAFHALNQRIENGANLLNGRTVTISALLTNGKLITGTATLNNLTSSDRNYIAVWDGDTNANGGILLMASTSDVTFSVRGLYGKSFSVMAVKMELGTRQTLAHQENGEWVLNELPNYGEELAKCQRYLFVVAPSGNSYGFAAFGNGRSGGAVIILSTPVTMRSANPTVTYSGPWSVIDRITDTPIAISSITYPRLSTNAISFIASFNGAVAGRLYEFFANDDPSAKLIVSCEI